MDAIDSQSSTRRLRVRHTTTYRYNQQVSKSNHILRLRPIYDWKQQVRSYKLTINPVSPNGKLTEYDDVFGNFVTRFDITTPYSELVISAESEVDVAEVDLFEFAHNLSNRPTFPVVWMPWEIKMMQPYLTPQELPDTQLKALYDYGMSFVQRNNGDLLETLFDINLTLFREYKYAPGSTTLTTTAFDVLAARQGVCQDLANLFIAIARLLSLPARYVCGYLRTGNTGQSRASSDASHAWVQVYLPNIGWKGFDPTNGVLPHLDHVRTAVGRNYRDTAPTTGTIYSPATESLSVDVEVADMGSSGQPQQQTSQPTSQQPAQQAPPQPLQQAAC